MARVFDCFTFFNEFDVLDLRLRMHNDFIDFFVVCESKKTWMQGDKELYFSFPEFSQKIILLDSTEMFLSENPWANEESQRNFLLEGIPLDISEDDLMIVSDVDELISQGILEQFKSSNSILSKIQIDFFYYNLRWRANEKWNKVFFL
jgi:hypothetical protein